MKRKFTIEYWNNHLKAWKESGLTQREYCKKNNVDEKAFGKKKVLRFGSNKKAGQKKSLDLVALPQDFVESAHHISSATYMSSGINIDLGNHSRINISKHFDHNCLSEVLKIISQL